MRRLAIFGIGAALIAAAPPGGSIGFLTAGRLADRCMEESTVSASYCFAFIAAVRDTAQAYEIWNKQREFCMPASTTQSEIRDAFLRKASREPQVKDGQAASVVLIALKDAYPCHAG